GNSLIQPASGREEAAQLPMPAIQRLGRAGGLRRENRAACELYRLLRPMFEFIEMAQMPERIGKHALVVQTFGHGRGFLEHSGGPQEKCMTHRWGRRSQIMVCQPNGD